MSGDAVQVQNTPVLKASGPSGGRSSLGLQDSGERPWPLSWSRKTLGPPAMEQGFRAPPWILASEAWGVEVS